MEKKPNERTAASTLDLFLDVELLHSLGCYRDAKLLSLEFKRGAIPDAGGALNRTRALNALLEEQRDDSSKEVRHPDPKKPDPTSTRKGARSSKREPEDAEESEAKKGEKADPHERGLLLSDTDASRQRLRRITDFYSTGIVALDYLLDEPKGKTTQERREEEARFPGLRRLGTCLFWDREPASSFRQVNLEFRQRGIEPDKPISQSVSARIEGKSGRYRTRRRAAEVALKPQLKHRGVWDESLAEEHGQALIGMDLQARPQGSEDCVTPGFILQCLVAAHLRLHEVEHFLSLPFGKAMTMSSVEIEEAEQWLREAEALNTFAYVASRSMPWMFAAGPEEWEAVVEECIDGFGAGDTEREDELRENSPSVFDAIWRSHRISFIALHRRAFGHSLRDALVDEGFNDVAFKDFHKLQRLLRVQRRASKRRVRVEAEEEALITPLDFLAALDALAETHIGDLYRADHAHPVALKHFCDAVDRLDHLSQDLLERERRASNREPEDEESRRFRERGLKEGAPLVASALRDSRWRVHLMMSKGKGFYEAGNLKRSIKWLLKSWCSFLVLVHHQKGLVWASGEKRGKALSLEELVSLFADIDAAIDSLEVIKNDPDFSKLDLEREVEKVIKEAIRIHVPKELTVIGSEILLRLGHVMFVLRLDAATGTKERHKLAEMCLRRARSLDDKSTLVLADQLKILHGRESPIPDQNKKYASLQWPYGRGNPEQMIRMIEYHLLRWLAVEEAEARNQLPNDGSPPRQDRHVARELIAGLLTHTDSINVRQSQVYRYLMQPSRPARRIAPAESWNDCREAPKRPEEAAIEFVCLRRYSSFFPFVPRPSAFRSLGGGYLLRLHHRDEACPNPFGVAVDPGPDFIENLYRCGFGLGDINMIVLTHDHPDHSVDLAPILSLMGYRMKHGDETFKAPDRGEPQAPIRRLLIVGNESVARQLSFFNKPHVSGRGAGDPTQMRPDAVQVVSFDRFDAFFRETMAIRERNQEPEVAIPDELRLKPVVSVRHPDGFGMLSYGFRLSLGDDGPSVGLTSDTGGFLLQALQERDDAGEEVSRWRIREHDQHGTMALSGHRTWREHWKPVLESDVLIPHVSGLPLAQLLVLANEGKSAVDWEGDEDGEQLALQLKEAWNGLEKNIRKQVSFAFWLPENEGKVSLPLEPIEKGTKWPKGHLYLTGLLEFARAYKRERERVDRPGLLLVGELREELGSLRGKIATSLNDQVFGTGSPASAGEGPGCRALTTDVGLRMMITREKGETQVRVLCSTCDLDNDRTPKERFHDPTQIREVCVKGENEGMFYNCSNHDPSQQTHPVFLERVERYDVFSAAP